ncbi:MAG TPA: LysM peptidoglycan-binding domain-containing protein, partial [Rectinemataceae bacterium]
LVDGLSYDIPMPWGHEEFEKYRESYLGPGGRRWLSAVMEAAVPYLDYVEKKIEEYGLPRELVFLPVIESEYSPHAVSRSGATGIWQFMRNSISGYGLSISEWKDERKDFMKSTDAALRKLKDNYSALGDWLLALAAYNAGQGAVSRAIRAPSGGTLDYWALYESRKLSREPLSYVPKFLAVASILRYPELHGILPTWEERQAWASVPSNRQVDIGVLAEKTGIPLQALKNANAELRYHITPPEKDHELKVPADKAQAVKELLESDSSPLFRYDLYTVKANDTLGAIAKRFGTPLSLVIQVNPGLKPDRISIGQKLIIPRIGAGASSPSQSPGAAQGKAGTSFQAWESTYTIRAGDTLWAIARKFGVGVRELAAANGIDAEGTLRIGAKLRVPTL